MVTAATTALVRRGRRALLPALRRGYVDGGAAPPKNPFEIHFHPTAADALVARKPSTAPTASSALETELQHELQSLHAEMADIFGEELVEHAAEGGSSTNSAAASESDDSFSPAPDTASGHPPVGALATNVAWTQQPSREEFSHKPRFGAADGNSILILQGPCSYLRDAAVGSNKPKHELLGEIHGAAARIGVSVSCRDSNAEGDILEWLLSADAGSSIVLCWNTRLSASPLVLRALEVLDSSVVVVSPLGIEHGPLPASVRGIISGMDTSSFEMALHAAHTLRQRRS